MCVDNKLINELPSPSSDKKDWPWGLRDDQFLNQMTISSPKGAWPKISIVTPSYNQGQYIEETIRSVLLQGYPNLEYIVIDGGSTDGSLEIIKRYEPWLTYWVSEPDSGMYEAINKGFEKSTGEIMAWAPAGDLYFPSALIIVALVFKQYSNIDWLTSTHKMKWDEMGRQIACYAVPGFSRRSFQDGVHFYGGNQYARYNIHQQSTFWRRRLWDQCGGQTDASMEVAGDFDLWAKFSQYTELYAIDTPLGIFRKHDSQASVRLKEQSLREKKISFRRSGGKHLGRIRIFIQNKFIRRLLSKFEVLGWFAYKASLAYRANILSWHSETQSFNLERRYFA